MIEAAIVMAAFFIMFFVNLFSIVSVIGIWPRFIEHRLLKKTYLNWELKPEHKHLEGIKIVYFSDLHFRKETSQKFLDKIVRRIIREKPDLILFTGDFLCYSRLEEPDRLKNFLSRFSAPLGCFCSFGNHDYATYVSRNKEGIYDTISPAPVWKGVSRGLRAAFSSLDPKSIVSPKALAVSYHENLVKLLKETPFTLLENATHTLPIGINISGLGELSLGRCRPETAFMGYDPQFPGLVLSHNPDTIVKLKKYPGDWILSGHTHGEQIHFPWPKWAKKLSNRLARLENPQYTRGLFPIGENKKLYVTRGVGAHKPFRFCSVPEICIIKTSVKQA